MVTVSTHTIWWEISRLPTQILHKPLRPPVSLSLLCRRPRPPVHSRPVSSRSRFRPRIGCEQGAQCVKFVTLPTERYRRVLSLSQPVIFLLVAIPGVESVIVGRSRSKRECSSHLRSINRTLLSHPSRPPHRAEALSPLALSSSGNFSE